MHNQSSAIVRIADCSAENAFLEATQDSKQKAEFTNDLAKNVNFLRNFQIKITLQLMEINTIFYIKCDFKQQSYGEKVNLRF